MKDITCEMLRFKEATRHIWNTYMSESFSSMSPETQNSFEVIERELLRILVFAPLNSLKAADVYRGRPITQIVVRPRTTLNEMPIQFGTRDNNHNMVWSEEQIVLVKDVPKLNFVEFFNWNPCGQVDLSYVKVVDANDGRVALIEQQYCEFVFNT